MRAHISIRQGASLTELAVVVAIIALIISVVAGGIKIQKASFIQGTVSAISSFQSAFENFNQKYVGLPGDLEDAEKYWPNTVNGNGDNRIDHSASGETESLRAWQQLSLSGLVQGGFSGKAAGSLNQADINVNVPGSGRQRTGFFVMYGAGGDSKKRNALVLGSFKPASLNDASALTPEEAKTIDAKTDDGLPLRGKTRAAKGTDNPPFPCVTDNAYNISAEDYACLQFYPIFP